MKLNKHIHDSLATSWEIDYTHPRVHPANCSETVLRKLLVQFNNVCVTLTGQDSDKTRLKMQDLCGWTESKEFID